MTTYLKCVTCVVIAVFFLWPPRQASAAIIGKPTNYLLLQSGLVGWWTFDQGDMSPNVRDRSSFANHGYIVGQTSTTTGEGRVGQALSFDGVNDTVNVSTVADDIATGDVSISFWFKRGSIVVDKYLFTLADAPSTNDFKGGFDASTGKVLQCGDGTNWALSGQLQWSNGWYHYVCTFSTTAGYKLYRDGVLVASNPTTTRGGTAATAAHIGGQFNGFNVKATIDEVRWYNRTLTQSDINQLYRLGSTKTASSNTRGSSVVPNLVAHWTFDANDVNWSTGAVTDKSGNGNTAYVANIGTTTGIKEGRVGQAFNFNGTNSKVTANSDVFGVEELTVSAWVRPNNSGENDSGIIAGTGQTHLHMGGDERPYFDNLLGVSYSYPADKTLPYKQWSHVAVTRYKNDWPVATSSPFGFFWAFGLDDTNDVLYAGSSVMLRCPLSNGCESASDWTEVWNMFASNSALATSFVFDSVNGVMYVGAEPSIYRCAVSTGCDTSTEWTLATSTPSTTIYDVKIDTTNGVIYAAGGLGPLGGVIYRCVLSTGCDGAGEWTIAYDMGPASATSLAFDSVNGVMYVVTDSDGVIYRCVLSTGCDTSGEWSLVYDSVEIPNFSYLGIDSTLGALYAGMGISLYYCNTSSGCDGVNDWATTSRSDVGIYTGMHVDEVRHKLYTRTGQVTINDLFVCSISTGCDTDNEFRLMYASFEGAFESGTFVVPDSGHVYYGDYGRFLRCDRGDACRLPYEPKMYINGRQVSLESTAYDTPALGSVTVIGNSVAMDSTFNGLIDDVRVYNRELTAGEINSLYGVGGSKVSVSQPGSDSLKSGLVGWWTFDGADMRPNIRDRSGQGNHGNLIGQTPTTTIEGKLGQALFFDGVNDLVTVPDNDAFDGTSSLSWSFWVNDTNATTYADFFTKGGESSGLSSAWAFMQNDSVKRVRLRMVSATSTFFEVYLDYPYLKGWKHVVVTLDGSLYRGYLNGQLYVSGSMAGALNATTDRVTMGGNVFGADAWKNSMDDVRIYNRTLTASEVLQLYNLGR